MNRFLPLLIGYAFVALCCLGCGGDSGDPASAAPAVDNRVAEPWMSKPKSEWPQIVLTNHAEFYDHSSLEGASGFLIKTNNSRVLAATAAHLIGAAGGVEPTIPINQLTPKIASWRMFPRTAPNAFVEIAALGVQGLDKEGLDWLILSIKKVDPLPAYPLKLRKEPVRVGETVFLIGCPYVEETCKQNVYTGQVTVREYSNRFRYDLEPPVELRGFSGAPIVDMKGYVVGVMTIWFDTKRSGDRDLEGGGEDIATIYESVHRAN